MLGRPSSEAEIFYRDWRAIASEYVLIGRVRPDAQDLVVRYELYDVLRQARIAEGPAHGGGGGAHARASRVGQRSTKS
jgi:TolB protein